MQNDSSFFKQTISFETVIELVLQTLQIYKYTSRL